MTMAPGMIVIELPPRLAPSPPRAGLGEAMPGKPPVKLRSVFSMSRRWSSMPRRNPSITSWPEPRRILRSTSAGPFQLGNIEVSSPSRPRTRANPDRMPEIRPSMIRRPALASQLPADENAPIAVLRRPRMAETIVEIRLRTVLIMADHPADHADFIALTPPEITDFAALMALLTVALIADQAADQLARRVERKAVAILRIPLRPFCTNVRIPLMTVDT